MNSTLPLTLKNIVVRKRGASILNDVSLTLEPTGLTVVMGPNGAGKTTLLRTMHGLERVRSGHVRWQVEEAEARGRQSFVFQAPILLRRSVLDNLTYPLTIRGEAKATAKDSARLWAAKLNIDQNLEMPARNLSGGEQQKLAVARALMSKPEVLFLDEPTTNLDGTSTREIEQILLEQLHAGTRIILTTHSVGQAKRLASDVVFLNKGRVCEHTLADVFFTSPRSDPASAFLNGDIVE